MATCKDCIHHGVCNCDVWLCRDAHGDLIQYQDSKEVEIDCENFADKSRFIELPCKIGQDAWMNRNYKGERHPQTGEISEMYFTPMMELVIVVKYVGRGIYGKTVFLTREEAEAALAERKDK